MRQQGEPSVDEILESIKRVMERDRQAQADPAASGTAKARPAIGGMDETPEPISEEEAEDVLDLGTIGAAMPDDDGYADQPLGDGAEASEPLTTDRAADAMRQSLAALAMLSEPPARPQIVRSGETSLEGLVREMLRPMLAQWLDANLPGMVEDMVKAEIARIAGKKN